jgi:hypothetical protein
MYHKRCKKIVQIGELKITIIGLEEGRGNSGVEKTS